MHCRTANLLADKKYKYKATEAFEENHAENIYLAAASAPINIHQPPVEITT